MKKLVNEKPLRSNNCRNYTTVDKREEPMDGVDALLFWINKICLLVRDDMEKFTIMNRNSGEQRKRSSICTIFFFYARQVERTKTVLHSSGLFNQAGQTLRKKIRDKYVFCSISLLQMSENFSDKK